MEKWTVEQEWSAIATAAVILGIVPDYSRGSMFKLNAMLMDRKAKGLVDKRKENEDWQGSPAFYKAKYFDKEDKDANAA